MMQAWADYLDRLRACDRASPTRDFLSLDLSPAETLAKPEESAHKSRKAREKQDGALPQLELF